MTWWITLLVREREKPGFSTPSPWTHEFVPKTPRDVFIRGQSSSLLDLTPQVLRLCIPSCLIHLVTKAASHLAMSSWYPEGLLLLVPFFRQRQEGSVSMLLEQDHTGDKQCSPNTSPDPYVSEYCCCWDIDSLKNVHLFSIPWIAD